MESLQSPADAALISLPCPTALPADANGQPGPPKRPSRASRACERCRDRKTKCDQQRPCSQCAYHSLKCMYRPSGIIRRRRRQTQQGNEAPKDRSASHPIRPCNLKQRRTDSAEGRNGSSHTEPLHNAADEMAIEPTIPLVSQPHEELAPAWGGEDGAEVEVEALMQEGPLSNMETPRLDGVNTHTKGTEFYGGSSNLAFLARLFVKARMCAGVPSHAALVEQYNGTRNSPNISQDAHSEHRHLTNDKLSIVNLMYSTDYHSPEDGRDTVESESDVITQTRIPGLISRTSTPDISGGRSLDACNSAEDMSSASSLRVDHSAFLREQSKETIQVEKLFIQAYFTGSHYIHPILSEDTFTAQCSTEIWPHKINSRSKMSLQSRRSHFLALYYAVVAIGAINAPIHETAPLATFYRNRGVWNGHSGAPKKRTTLEWANIYFGLARQALGNILETSSLESCQALFIMTVFCQNALKPHACYMYSGTALRTAIAIGLSSKSSRDYMVRKEEARKTWWCIYSHEIEMCCSSGRLDALKPSRQYSLPMPKWTDSPHTTDSDKEGGHIAIIPIMVELAQIFKTASQDIYDDSRERTISDKSRIGFQLHSMLDTWKANLPSFLDFDVNSLDDSEWAFKQKLVLKMRFLNARIVIHRPFLAASSTSNYSSEFSRHLEICLDASRKTIHLIHDAFVNRIYLRTWWYCTTYTLYASMIILYLILMEFPKVSGEELIADVEKSLEIFSAMKSVVVARRCAEFTREMIGVAKRYLQHCRQRQAASTGAMMTAEAMFPDDALLGLNNQNMCTESEVWNDTFLAAILNQEMPNLERANALANLYDPNILEGFALSGSESAHGPSPVTPSTNYSTAQPGDENGQAHPVWGVFESFREGNRTLGASQGPYNSSLLGGEFDWS